MSEQAYPTTIWAVSWMPMRPDAFGDVLEPGEKILVAIGAPRQTLEGESLGWVHVALTEDRFLVAEITPLPGKEEFRVGRRDAIDRSTLSLERHPRSDEGPARLVILGMEETLVLAHMDRPELFTQLRPFLAIWSGPIGGPGPISLRMEGSMEPSKQRIRLTRLPGLLLGLTMGSSLGLFLLWWLD